MIKDLISKPINYLKKIKKYPRNNTVKTSVFFISSILISCMYGQHPFISLLVLSLLFPWKNHNKHVSRHTLNFISALTYTAIQTPLNTYLGFLLRALVSFIFYGSLILLDADEFKVIKENFTHILSIDFWFKSIENLANERFRNKITHQFINLYKKFKNDWKSHLTYISIGLGLSCPYLKFLGFDSLKAVYLLPMGFMPYKIDETNNKTLATFDYKGSNHP